jgi:hypothetical protein
MPAAQRRTVRRAVRRATPATLTGVNGRPTTACASEMKPCLPDGDTNSDVFAKPKASNNATAILTVLETLIISLPS